MIAVEIDTGPFISGYNPRPIVEMDDGTLVFTAGAADPMFNTMGWENPPNAVIHGLGNELDENGQIIEGPSVVFICRSRGGGASWTETRFIARPEYYFVESTMI